MIRIQVTYHYPTGNYVEAPAVYKTDKEAMAHIAFALNSKASITIKRERI